MHAGAYVRNDMRVSSRHSDPRHAPPPRFEHRPVRGMSPRIEAYCLVCKRFVAAGDKLAILRIAEKAHICAISKGPAELWADSEYGTARVTMVTEAASTAVW